MMCIRRDVVKRKVVALQTTFLQRVTIKMVFPPPPRPPPFLFRPPLPFVPSHLLPFGILAPPYAPLFPTSWSPCAPHIDAFGERNRILPMMQLGNAQPTMVINNNYNNCTNCTIYGGNEREYEASSSTSPKRKSCDLENVHESTSKTCRRNPSVATAPSVRAWPSLSHTFDEADCTIAVCSALL
jgi:hypothetical protein